ncbi:unnamed protein product [Cyprideis torosa]|uniref:ATP synthase subunit d, mitochondrial n=1 Tax=Cyprideis torosa TaxID=163714 RepID=A0A7R8ZNX1_9CRUS|nr:unnamed protein product [Cyprideis torosa]CAG0887339.1 unnamed protein product [Cyprideis torosa]
MAARRITKSAIDWGAFAERVPKDQYNMFTAFRSKSEQYVRKMQALPMDPPKIDWSNYTARVMNPAVVEGLKKQYESIKVPYPADNVTKLVDEQEKQEEPRIQEFIAQSQARSKEVQAELAKFEDMTPILEWTTEEFVDAFPKTYDPYRPSMPPGYKCDQLGYVPPGGWPPPEGH